MEPTWEKSPFPFLGRPGKSMSENPGYMLMCISGMLVVVLLFKWYCLWTKKKKTFSWFKVHCTEAELSLLMFQFITGSDIS